jgi:hypothetical protein
MRKHGTLRRRKEIIRDKSNGFDRGVSGNVMTHGQGYSDNLRPQPRPYQNRIGGGNNPDKSVTSLGESGSRGCEGGMTLVLRSGVRRTPPLTVEGATGTCNSVGCAGTDMGEYDMFFVWALARNEGAGVSDYE